MEGNCRKNDNAVSEEPTDGTATSSAAMDDDAVTGQIGIDNQVYTDKSMTNDSTALLDTSRSGNNEGSPGNDVSQGGHISCSTDGVRKRASSTSRDQAVKDKNGEMEAPKKESSGLFSLVLLWIVVLSLVILIFRRLCMDALLIGESK